MVSAYLGIVNDLSDRIHAGDLQPGDRVPSTRQISAQWGVAIATATKALAELQRRGLVRLDPLRSNFRCAGTRHPQHRSSGA